MNKHCCFFCSIILEKNVNFLSFMCNCQKLENRLQHRINLLEVEVAFLQEEKRLQQRHEISKKHESTMTEQEQGIQLEEGIHQELMEMQEEKEKLHNQIMQLLQEKDTLQKKVQWRSSLLR